MPYTRGKKRLPAAAIVGVKVNTNFVSQAYLAALACADKTEGKRPTLPLKDWTKLVADKNGWQETMIATVCSEWFARLWVARSTDNLHLIFKATEETVKDYERVLENRHVPQVCYSQKPAVSPKCASSPKPSQTKTH